MRGRWVPGDNCLLKEKEETLAERRVAQAKPKSAKTRAGF